MLAPVSRPASGGGHVTGGPICRGPRLGLGVSEVAIAGVAAAAASLSSVLTGWLTLRAAAVERRDRSRAELATAMASFGYAADRLRTEIEQLPPPPSRSGRATATAVERLPTLDWSLGQISRHKLGRPAMRALDAYGAAANRLLLVAPQPVLEAMERLSDLLAKVQSRDEAWSETWRDARNEFAVAARDASLSDKRFSRRATLSAGAAGLSWQAKGEARGIGAVVRRAGKQHRPLDPRRSLLRGSDSWAR